MNNVINLNRFPSCVEMADVAIVFNSIHRLNPSFKPYSQTLTLVFNPMGFFGNAHRWGTKKAALPKFCHTYSTNMKLGTVILYTLPKQDPKEHKSDDTPFDFC